MLTADTIHSSRKLIKRLINNNTWLDLLHDFRSEEGVAEHFNLTLKELQQVKKFWEIKWVKYY